MVFYNVSGQLEAVDHAEVAAEKGKPGRNHDANDQQMAIDAATKKQTALLEQSVAITLAGQRQGIGLQRRSAAATEQTARLMTGS
jgi:hypothetical protein